MKLQLLSDVHIEFGDFEVSPAGDVLILAGDIGVIKTHKKEFEKLIRNATYSFEKVIFVPGNHEFYHGDYLGVHEFFRKINKEFDELEVLIYGNSVEYDGVTFIGGTLWSDLSNPMDEIIAKDRMNDFFVILNSDKGMDNYSGIGRWSPHDATLEHYATVQKIKETEIKDPNKTVVITHHSPSFQSVTEHFRGDKLNPAYHTSLENLILDMNPKYWFHGHIHQSVDYMIGDTRVMTNPRGYEGHFLNENFNPKFVVEI